jgi:predicted nucleic acid-binding protein
MRVFIDTNILLDVVEQRTPHYADSLAVLERTVLKGDQVFMAWHTLANVFYIYGKKAGVATARQALQELLQVITVATVGHAQALQAFTLGFDDLEDALQAVAAEACFAHCIITRNAPDFATSPVSVLTPKQFLAQFP